MNEKEGADAMGRGSVLFPRVLYSKIRGRFDLSNSTKGRHNDFQKQVELAKSNPQALNGYSFYLHYSIKLNRPFDIKASRVLYGHVSNGATTTQISPSLKANYGWR